MSLERELVTQITKCVLNSLQAQNEPPMVIAGVSNRHVHLCREHVDVLFGAGYELNVQKMLRQPGEYASKETINVATYGGIIENVRVLGPIRKASQCELSASDARKLRIKPPLLKSGGKAACPSVTLIGPKGSVTLDSGVCMAWRHVHLSTEEAAVFGLKDGQEIDVEIKGDRGIIFNKVWVRVNDAFLSEFHADTDEAAACGLASGDMVRLVW